VWVTSFLLFQEKSVGVYQRTPASYTNGPQALLFKLPTAAIRSKLVPFLMATFAGPATASLCVLKVSKRFESEPERRVIPRSGSGPKFQHRYKTVSRKLNAAFCSTRGTEGDKEGLWWLPGGERSLERKRLGLAGPRVAPPVWRFSGLAIP